MATALCGLQSTGSSSKPVKTHREHRRKARDSKRRQAALLFLNNISLDGRPQCQFNDGNNDQKAAEEQQRPGERDVGAAVEPPPADSQAPVAPVTEPAAASSGSSSSFPGVVSPTPTRPSLVMSPGPAGASAAVGANEVFLEGVCAAETQQPPDTPLSPVPAAGQQPCGPRVKSAPSTLSPVPTGNTVDSRQR